MQSTVRFLINAMLNKVTTRTNNTADIDVDTCYDIPGIEVQHRPQRARAKHDHVAKRWLFNLRRDWVVIWAQQVGMQSANLPSSIEFVEQAPRSCICCKMIHTSLVGALAVRLSVDVWSSESESIVWSTRSTHTYLRCQISIACNAERGACSKTWVGVVALRALEQDQLRERGYVYSRHAIYDTKNTVRRLRSISISIRWKWISFKTIVFFLQFKLLFKRSKRRIFNRWKAA